MGEWWTYRPEDFLLFSDRVYWRLFELHNAAVWPAQVAALGLGAALLWLSIRPTPRTGRFVALALAAAWVFVAWAFLWLRFRTVNWAIAYVVPLFALEALLLLWAGVIGNRLRFGRRAGVPNAIGLTLLVYAVCLHPFVAIVSARPASAAEVFAIAPDPLAVGTLGVLSMASGRTVVLALLPVPVLWCALSGITLRTLGAWEAAIPLAAIALTLVAMSWPLSEKSA